MNTPIQQLGLSIAANWRRHSYASVNGFGGSRLSGMHVIPAHTAFNRCNLLATDSGEPMT